MRVTFPKDCNRFMIPAGIYLFKVNNGNTKAMCKICSKLTINTPERRHWSCFVVSIVYLEHNANIVLVFQNHSHPWGQCSQYIETIINCSKSTIKTPERRYFLLVTLNIIFYTVLGQSPLTLILIQTLIPTRGQFSSGAIVRTPFHTVV